MNKKKHLDKAVTDSLTTVVQEGIDVNICIETATYLKLIFLAIIIAGVFIGSKYALLKLKIK